MGYVGEIRKKIGHDRLITVGATAIVYKNRRVLLQKRRDNGLWSSHGGCVEIGEEVENAARRELMEETGLRANSLEFMGVFSGEDMLYTYPNGDEAYIIGIEYVCRDFSGDMLFETDETLELKWFELHDLPKELSSVDRKLFDGFLNYIKRTDV